MISQAIKIQLGSLEGGGGKVLGSEALVKAQDLVCSSVDVHFTTLIFLLLLFCRVTGMRSLTALMT